MNGQTFKRCGCRDEHGKQRGKACPLLERTSHGTWWYRVDIGPGVDDGKFRQRRQRSKGGYPTKKDAGNALAHLVSSVGSGSHVDAGRITVGTWLEDWLAGKGGLRPTTARSYRSHLDLYLIPHLGHLKLSALRTVDVERMYQAIAAKQQQKPATAKRVSRRPMGAASMRRLHATLMSSLNTAVKRRVIPWNPAAHVELQQAPRPTVTVWTPAHVGAFLDATAGDRLAAMWHFMAFMGTRRGETVGLRWVDVDLDKATARVEQQIVQLGYATAVGAPKTKSGIRVLSLDAGTVEVLRTHRARQAAERLVWGEAWTDSGLVFTREDGTQLHPEYVSRRFGRLAKAAKLPRIRLHDLRHTSASLGLEAGESLVEVQRRLGHSSITLTADTYTHVAPAVAQSSSDKRAAIVPRGVSPLAQRVVGSVPTSCPQGPGNDSGPSSRRKKSQVRKGAPPGTRTPDPLIKSQLL